MVKRIIDIINSFQGGYSGYQVFADWVKACAISISNSTELCLSSVWKERENQYMELLGKYGAEGMDKFADMLGMLALELENNPSDVLGEVYMNAGFGSKSTGQFFTPFHLSELTARLIYKYDELPLHLHEPSCGGGGMIIAVYKDMLIKGLDPQRNLKVVAQDLEWNAVYMCYVQLSLLGISAVVVQGDTLTEPYSKETPEHRVLYTPKKRGLLI